MILLSDPLGLTILILTAAILGGAGGLVAELLLRENAGRLERPATLKSFWDLGFWANVIIGGVASLIYFGFFGATSIKQGTETISVYEIRTVLAASLIVGTAGGAVIAAMQTRILATINDEKNKKTLQLAKAQLAGLNSKGLVPEPDFQAAIDALDAIQRDPE
jgi:hypothetical protein